jgi:hypothetical protein
MHLATKNTQCFLKHTYNMKINEIEAGEKQPISVDVLTNIFNECSDAVSAMKATSSLLYRGLLNTEIDAFYGKSRKYRRPLDLKPSIQEFFDNAMRSVGMEAVRSNSIFCSSDLDQAMGYGSTYIIFPKNGFKFSWSPIVRDLASKIGGYTIEELSTLGITYQKVKTRAREIEKTIKALINAAYDCLKLYNGSLQHEPNAKAVRENLVLFKNNIRWFEDAMGHELADTNIIASTADFLTKNNIIDVNPHLKDILSLPLLLKELNHLANADNPKEVGLGLQFTNKDFAKALESNKEIMISGEYYAFSYGKYIKEIRNALYEGK